MAGIGVDIGRDCQKAPGVDESARGEFTERCLEDCDRFLYGEVHHGEGENHDRVFDAVKMIEDEDNAAYVGRIDKAVGNVAYVGRIDKAVHTLTMR